MDQLKSLIHKIFDKNTDRGRTLRTFLQALIGITSYLSALVAIPGFSDVIAALAPELQLTAIATWVAIITLTHNKLEKLWAWIHNGE